MDNLGKELLDFLATAPLKKARSELYNSLGARGDEVNVYYLVSLSNLRSIIADGGIKCRATAGKDGIDLSAQYVQEMRDKTLRLVQKISLDKEIISKNLHECVNFFWNPINNTFRAFQRNSLLIESNQYTDIDGIVCILEMRLNSFFESNKVYWSVSEKNLASYVSPSFYKRDYEKFNWPSIFGLKNDRNSNQARSAEFIAFYKNPGLINSGLIPARFIRRILVPIQHEQTIKEILPSVQNQIYLLTNSEIFLPKENLLKAKKNLIKTLFRLQKLGLTIEEFCRLINSFSNFSEQLGCSLTENFFDKRDMAHSKHGLGHVTRVMLWVHILCYLSRTSHTEEKAIQYAAFIHDLCREDNSEEEIHGSFAVLRYEDFIRQKEIPESLKLSCMNAVIYHCKKDSECPEKDIIWKLLKDADSLDRGRFGHPKGLSNIRQESNGCEVSTLRSGIFRESPQLAEKLAWLAYWIAGITRYTKWSENTFMNLKRAIIISLHASLRNDILEPDERQIADKMLRYLSVC